MTPDLLYARLAGIIDGNEKSLNRHTLPQTDGEISVDVMTVAGGRIGPLNEVAINEVATGAGLAYGLDSILDLDQMAREMEYNATIWGSRSAPPR